MCRRATGALLAILLFLSGCSSRLGTGFEDIQTSTPTPRPPVPVSQVPPVTPDAVLTRVQGEVHVQQVLTNRLVLASFGDYLWQGDVIVTKQDAQAEAMCSDGIFIRVAPDQRLPVTCGETPDPVCEQVILRVHREQIEVLLSPRPGAPGYGNMPVVLSPRNTWLADGRPAIRWRAVKDAEDYEVVVSGPKGEVWRATTQKPELRYPEAQPALQAGVKEYHIQVIARMGLAEPPRPSEAVWVTVLSAAEAEQVRQFETQVDALGLSADSAHFFLAAYYADQGLYDAAIVELVPLVEAVPSPPVHRLLGYVYRAVELDREAERSYTEARRLAWEQRNWMVEAEAEVGLGHAAFAAGRVEEALSHYRAAMALYQELGLESNASAVAQLVADVTGDVSTTTP